jgi:glucose/arabinose dehydrogenase
MALATTPHALAQGGLGLRLVGEFTSPNHVDNAPGTPSQGLLFVVEDAGVVRVVNRGVIEPEPFLDIHNRVEDLGEQGLLSIAFPPDYASSGRFYVYFTNNLGNNQIFEFQVNPDDPTDALEGSARAVISFQHPGATNHNGGNLQFTPDGLLWVATGDGGGGGDPNENAQSLSSLLGKLIRIDPRQSGSSKYTVPPSNPFVGLPGRDEIWSYGFRNPWRISFDATTQRLSIGDVGQALWEEVDYETRGSARGANFGWDNYEGTHLFEGPALTEHEQPIFEYSSADGTGNCAVTGGYVVRDPNLPQLYGRYLYADYCAGDLRSFVPAFDGATDDASTGLTVANPTSFGEGAARRIYVATSSGAVYQLISN